MASLPVPTEPLFEEQLPGFVLVRADQVDEGDRLRPVDPVWAEALGQIMAREGQRTPIEVCRLPGRSRWTLVAGGHRLAGARLADIEFLRAEVVGADRDERRSREISENLWRDDLLPLDRAAFIAEAVAIQKRRAGIDPAKDGRAVSAAVRWQKQLAEDAGDASATIAVAYNLTAELVDAIGLSARTIRDDLMLHRRLPASLIEKLRGAEHPVLLQFGQLKALAKLDEVAQHRAVDALVAGATTVAKAVGTNRPSDPDAKRLSAFIGAFSRMGVAEKKAALFQLEGMLPAGIRLEVGRDEAKPALDAAHDFFQEVDLWDPESPIELLADRAKTARVAVKSALMTINGSRPRGNK